MNIKSKRICIFIGLLCYTIAIPLRGTHTRLLVDQPPTPIQGQTPTQNGQQLTAPSTQTNSTANSPPSSTLNPAGVAPIIVIPASPITPATITALSSPVTPMPATVSTSVAVPVTPAAANPVVTSPATATPTPATATTTPTPATATPTPTPATATTTPTPATATPTPTPATATTTPTPATATPTPAVTSPVTTTSAAVTSPATAAPTQASLRFRPSNSFLNMTSPTNNRNPKVKAEVSTAASNNPAQYYYSKYDEFTAQIAKILQNINDLIAKIGTKLPTPQQCEYAAFLSIQIAKVQAEYMVIKAQRKLDKALRWYQRSKCFWKERSIESSITQVMSSISRVIQTCLQIQINQEENQSPLATRTPYQKYVITYARYSGYLAVDKKIAFQIVSSAQGRHLNQAEKLQIGVVQARVIQLMSVMQTTVSQRSQDPELSAEQSAQLKQIEGHIWVDLTTFNEQLLKYLNPNFISPVSSDNSSSSVKPNPSVPVLLSVSSLTKQASPAVNNP